MSPDQRPARKTKEKGQMLEVSEKKRRQDLERVLLKRAALLSALIGFAANIEIAETPAPKTR
jgi:hypothetical protein